jgi:predicted RNA-binding Zn-ribbon protein involved in translation (DUF1610 family)
LKKWLNILLKYDKTGYVGSCPECGEETVSVTEHAHKNGTKSITFKCETCKKGAHFN